MNHSFIGAATFLCLPSVLTAATITISDGGIVANLQEDTRSLGFARSIGQTFAVPSPTTENRLMSFTFYVDSNNNPVDLDAAAYVFEWDTANTSPTGSALYSSGAFAINSPGSISFSGISLILDPAKTYIAFLSTSGLQDQDNNAVDFDASQTSGYLFGQGVRYTGTLTTTAAFTGDPTNWDAISPDWDFRFDAVFDEPGASGVPEPGGIALFAIGIAGLSAYRTAIRKGALLTPPLRNTTSVSPESASDGTTALT